MFSTCMIMFSGSPTSIWQSSLVGVFLQHNSVWLRVTWSLYKKTKSTSYLLTGSLLVLGSNRMLAPSVHIWLWQNCSRWRPSTKERQTMRCHEGQQLPFLHKTWKTKVKTRKWCRYKVKFIQAKGWVGKSASSALSLHACVHTCSHICTVHDIFC